MTSRTTLLSMMLLMGGMAGLAAHAQETASTGQWDRVVATARSAVMRTPDSAEAWRELGTALAQSGQTANAVQAFGKALELNPRDGAAWRDLGWSRWTLKQYDEALQALNMALLYGASNRDQLLQQIVAPLAELDRPAEAVAIYRKWKPDGSLLGAAQDLAAVRRDKAAEPFFQAAWGNDENRPVAGLHLAYAQATRRDCGQAMAYLAPFLEQRLLQAPPVEIDRCLDCLRLCSSADNILPLVDKLDAALGNQPQHAVRLTDFIEEAALRLDVPQHYPCVLQLYQRVLASDPDRRRAWARASLRAESLGLEDVAHGILTNVLARAKTPGVEGRLADRRGDWEAAAGSYAACLKLDSDQPEVRRFYFDACLRLGRLQEARSQADWFESRTTTGDASFRSILADIWVQLREDQKAHDAWQTLQLAAPEVVYYGLARADALFRLGRGEDALNVLRAMTESSADPRIFERLAEIELAMGRPQQAADWATNGLAIAPSRNQLRLYAESAELVGGMTTGALQAATDYLGADPGYVPMAQYAGRALQTLGLQSNAAVHWETLLDRNPAFLPALLALRALATQTNDTDTAIAAARTAATQRPWDPEAKRRLAISLGEDQRFRAGLKLLRPIAEYDIRAAAPVLIYRNINAHDYPGLNTLRQFRSHVEALTLAGFQLTLPVELDVVTNAARVILVLVDPEEAVLRQADAILARTDGKAVCALNTDVLLHAVPAMPTPDTIAELRANGRWLFASSGNVIAAQVPVTTNGVLGSMLTHRLIENGTGESVLSQSNRLDRWMTTAAASLGATAPKMLVYPRGDYGQLSLDTDEDALAALRLATAGHFDLALATDDSGFACPEFEPLRLAGRVVPAAWDGDDLMAHIQRSNPILRSKTELAKLYYWHRQHVVANAWFRRAFAAGADPGDILYSWGANAVQEGDRHTALKRLEEAQAANPQSARTAAALAGAKLNMRPSALGYFEGWEDNEDRLYYQWGGEADAFVSRRVQLGALASQAHWERTGLPAEEGTRVGGKLLWYLREEMWADVRLWELLMDSSATDDLIGGQASWHIPIVFIHGYAECLVARDVIETVEAIQENLNATDYALRTYSRAFDDWDVYVDGLLTDRSDNNTTRGAQGRVIKRLHEWPFLGVGYAFRFADSDEDPPEYWAPLQLQQHQVYAAWRGSAGRFTHALSGEAGVAEEIDTDWQFVWGVRASGGFRLTRLLQLSGDIGHFEGPSYERTTYRAGISGRF